MPPLTPEHPGNRPARRAVLHSMEPPELLKGFGAFGVFEVAEWIHFTLFEDSITRYKTKGLHFWGG